MQAHCEKGMSKANKQQKIQLKKIENGQTFFMA